MRLKRKSELVKINMDNKKFYGEVKKLEQNFQVGDIVETKKQHPCGSKLWKITRIGVDFKLECQGCGHVVMIERPKVIKMIKKKV